VEITPKLEPVDGQAARRPTHHLGKKAWKKRCLNMTPKPVAN